MNALEHERKVIVSEADFANLSLLRPGAELQRKLEHANIVSTDAVPPDVITMQSQVILRDGTTGDKRQVKVVYPAEADPAAGRISVLDPLGTMLLGASIGNTLLHGRKRLRIDEVVYQPEDSMRTHLVVRD